MHNISLCVNELGGIKETRQKTTKYCMVSFLFKKKKKLSSYPESRKVAARGWVVGNRARLVKVIDFVIK